VSSVQKRHVAIARLRSPANLGRTSQEVWFIILVITSTKEVAHSQSTALFQGAFTQTRVLVSRNTRLHVFQWRPFTLIRVLYVLYGLPVNFTRTSSFCAGCVFIKPVWSEKHTICINLIYAGHNNKFATNRNKWTRSFNLTTVFTSATPDVYCFLLAQLNTTVLRRHFGRCLRALHENLWSLPVLDDAFEKNIRHRILAKQYKYNKIVWETWCKDS